MANINFSGLATGLDTEGIIGALVGVERIPLQQLEAENRNLQSKTSIIDNLSSSLSKLSTKAQALGSLGDFLSFSGSLSDESVGKVTASGDAVAGNYKLEVTQLAQAQRTYSNAFADKTAALSTEAQTLTFTINGEDTVVDIEAGTSLAGVVEAINGSGADVTAGMFYDGTQYRLQVVGNATGEDNAISFSDSGLGLGLDVPANTIQAAQNAMFKLDDFEIESASNTVDGILPGVTLELQEETSSPVTLQIKPDSGAVKDKIKGFVDAYNAVFGIINAQVGEGKGRDTLNGDSTLRAIEQQLGFLVSTPVSGLSGYDGAEGSLGQLGIKTGKDGTLSIDDDALDGALAKGFRTAGRIFGGDPASGIDGISALFEAQIDAFTDTTDGLLTIRKKGIKGQIDSNSSRIEDKERYLAAYEQQLRDTYTRLETTVSGLRNQQQYLAQFLLQG